MFWVVGGISARVLFGQLTSPLETRFDAISSRFNEHITRVEKTSHILEVERKLLKESLEARDKAGNKYPPFSFVDRLLPKVG